MKNIAFGTRNATKMSEGRAFFAGTGINLLSMDDLNIEGSAVEDKLTLEGNASAKAAFVYQRAGGIGVITDDTGLYIGALGGAPGVDAAIWGGKHLTWQERTPYCLKLLEGVEDRSATFVTVVVVILPDGRRRMFQGRVDGHMRAKALCKPKEQMPYSPLFMPVGRSRCFAEMTDDEENAISHRGQAFQRALAFLLANEW